MLCRRDTESSEEPGSGSGDGGVRAGDLFSGVKAGLRRFGPLRILCVVLACSLVLSFLPSAIYSAGVHFGLVSAIKTKVKELAKKVQARTAPHSLTVVKVTTDTVSLSWKDNAKDESAIGIERKTSTCAYSQIWLAAPNTIAYIDTGLVQDTTYYYRVRAKTPVGWSNYSNVVSTKTAMPGGAGAHGEEGEGEDSFAIGALTAVPRVVLPSAVSTITCTAVDPGGSVLTYTWAVSSGTFTELGTGGQIAWTAPASTGIYTITCMVVDGEGGSAERSVDVWVGSGPVIISLTPTPAKVSTGTVSNIVCIATAPENAVLSYVWTAASGTITGSGESAVWLAPDSTGTYLITCEADDASGGAAFMKVGVLVNNPPVISALTALPRAVLPLMISTITCAATDPDNPITYTWSAGTGTAAGIHPWQIAWTAPASTGVYTVGCVVTDGEGGEDQRTVEVWVGTGPVIISLMAAPPTVSTGAFSDIVCDATAPANAALTYVWTAGSGTFSSSERAVRWFAPPSTGTYVITCEVTAEPGGAKARRSVSVLVNNPPVITSLTAEPPVVSSGTAATITCATSDPDSSNISYLWSALGGTFNGTSAQVEWLAPDATGSYEITCVVEDGEGGSAQKTVLVYVSSVPIIDSLTIVPELISTGTVAALSCKARAPDHDTLAYSWSAGSGTITSTGGLATWTAPLTTGSYILACEVTGAPGGGVTRQNLVVLVNNPPVISSLTADPERVYPSAVSTVTCVAADPDNPVLSYEWSDARGTFAGTGGKAEWTAPASPGSYAVTCDVFDGEGGSARMSVNIDVSSVPEITSLTYLPEKVSTGTPVTITCAAQAPGTDTLAYAWSAASGAITGTTGEAATWQAPEENGIYLVDCAVTGLPGGGVAYRSIAVVVNNPPEILSLTAAPARVSPLRISTITCVAIDEDSVFLSYEWSAETGTFTGTGAQVEWTAPDSTGTYAITCKVSDGKGSSAQKSMPIDVSSVPVIASLTYTPDKVSTGTVTTMACAAEAPNNDPMAYHWTAGSGTFNNDTGQSVSWTAPDSTGTYLIECEVTVLPGGGAARKGVSVLVNNPPVISGMLVDPRLVYPASISSITCVAKDPDNPVLFYEWMDAAGTIPGTAAEFYWTAPKSTGTYALTCKVSDGEGGFDQESVSIDVSSLPIIDSLTAEPMKVSSGIATNLTCTARAPGTDTLTYNWIAASGTFSDSAAEVTWTAPDSTATYALVCEVTAVPGGGVTRKNVRVLVNNPPRIVSLLAVPDKVSPGQISTVTCVATDPDNAVLFYQWSDTNGTLAATGSELYWTAPAEAGTYAISCKVSDGEGGSAQAWASVPVNNSPQITSLTRNLAWIAPVTVSTLTCVATNPDSTALAYDWTADGGSFAGTGMEVKWTAPSATGTYTISCEVSDPEGGSDLDSVQINVSSIPVINAVAPNPAHVPNGGASSLLCTAQAPGNTTLTYSWSAGSGTVVGSGASAVWTAPSGPFSTGTYTVTCEVTAVPGSGAARMSAAVLVNNPPDITSVTGNPAWVSPNKVSVITCAATDPDNTTLFYDWTPTGGTVSGIGAQVNWTAPGTDGSYTINCVVSDGEGGSHQDSATIMVSSEPVISLVDASPLKISTGTATTVTCTAEAPDNDTISYNWSAASGTFLGSGASATTWTAPDSTGTYLLTCEVTATTGGGKTRQAVSVLVNNPPVIVSLTADPSLVVPSEISTVTCVATDPDNTNLIYVWTAASGTITGSGYQVKWLAPDLPDTYSITCKVYDGEGGMATRTIPLSAALNLPPIINFVLANPEKVPSNGSTAISCVADDPEGRTLTYNWSAGSGTITGSGMAVTWDAPASTRTYSISCEVTDDKGASVQGGITVLVNNPPVIDSLSADPPFISLSDVSTITCTATDPDNGPARLSYTWSKTAGTFTGTGHQVKWTAPASTGVYTLGCEVGDGEGGTDYRAVSVTISSMPLINSLTAVPPNVSTSAASLITCVATAPGDKVLSYTWAPGSGTITGSGASVTWTAPASTRTYIVSCAVSYPGGGVAYRSITILVNNPPVITSLTAAPRVVSPSGASTVNCAATDPDNLSNIFYTWSNTGGTIAGTGAIVTWTAPLATGTYTVGCTVEDGEGGSAQNGVDIIVSSSPIITALAAAPASVLANGVSTITCTALGPDNNDTLLYTWTPGSGTITGTGLEVKWTAPVSTGTYQVRCSVADGYGHSADRVVEILVGGVAWIKQDGTTAGDAGYAVAADTSGNVFVAGDTMGNLNSNTNKGNRDAFLIKYSSDGVSPWTVLIGSGSYDYGRGVAIDPSGNIFVAGYTYGRLAADTTWYGNTDFFLAKYSNAGTRLWAKQYGTGDYDYAYGVAVDASGNVFVAGETGAKLAANTTWYGGPDAFLAKYNSNGDNVWTVQLGSFTSDSGSGVAVDPSGNIIICGKTDDGVEGNANLGGNDFFLGKYSNATGAKIWVKQYGTNQSDDCSGVGVDPAGNIFVTGITSGDFGGPAQGWGDLYVAKYDANGNNVWKRQAGGGGYEFSNGIAVDPSGNAFVTGVTQSGFDGNVLIGGTPDVFLVKYDTTGAKLWTKQFGSPQPDMGYGVAVDSFNNVFTTGETFGDFGTAQKGVSDIFLTKHVQ